MGCSRRAFSKQLTNNWLRSLGVTATTGEAKEYHGQLQSVLDFFNNGTSQKLKAIDWEGHKERIHTAGIVEKVHNKYDNFMKTSYSVEAAVGRIGHSTDQLQSLDVAMQYNFMLYFVHYSGHLDQLEVMRNIGDLN